MRTRLSSVRSAPATCARLAGGLAFMCLLGTAAGIVHGSGYRVIKNPGICDYQVWSGCRFHGQDGFCQNSTSVCDDNGMTSESASFTSTPSYDCADTIPGRKCILDNDNDTEQSCWYAMYYSKPDCGNGTGQVVCMLVSGRPTPCDGTYYEGGSQ